MIMKKNNYLFLCLFMIVAVVSCTKEMTNNMEDESILKGKKVVLTEKVPSSPVSAGDITPWLIPGINPGGNRTCAEVGTAFAGDADFFYLCGDKVDYEYNEYGDGSFTTEFPDGLYVTTDGRFVSFELDGCFKIGEKSYKIGAVIVKGSDQANVFFYPDGAYSDSGLAAPFNSSGGPAGLSNLTFCFLECTEVVPEFIIALKTYLTIPGEEEYAWAVSGGEDSNVNSLHMGYKQYTFNAQNVFPLNYWGIRQIGTISASDYWENNIHYLEVVVDTYSDDWLFKGSYHYVGSLEGFERYCTLESDGLVYTNYGAFPFSNEIVSGTRIFKIPFYQITE